MDRLATVPECIRKIEAIPRRSADSTASIALEPGGDQHSGEFRFSEIAKHPLHS